ncbi:hypothetical protein C1H46_044214 [Malus baccata]|uniref:G-patch domain-containing protein n=1 Tax=Malus baccata TaxID=106549 RepID=A0A540K7Q5_MALBA|nr:hypothetical protein C1H46_044214 [Malus baccata]
MLGGLYGDLPPPSSAEEEKPSNSTVWSSSTKMAPQTLRKPSSIFAPPQTILKPQSKPKSSNAVQPKITASPAVALSPAVIYDEVERPELVGVTSTVLEEYDPARPNDYEEYRRERKKKAMEAEMRRELDRRRQEEEERERKEREEREREKERDLGESRNISGEEAWRRRAAMSGAATPVVPRSPSPPSNADGFIIGKSDSGGLGLGAGGQMTAAQRMMAKMGWKQGQGLGKQEQGITTPLMAKKTDRRAGVIVNASETKPEKKAKSVSLNGPPTRVLLLRNMANEAGFCSKGLYGNVLVNSFFPFIYNVLLTSYTTGVKFITLQKLRERRGHQASPVLHRATIPSTYFPSIFEEIYFDKHIHTRYGIRVRICLCYRGIQFHRLMAVMRLLKHGYTVRTTVRDPTNQKKSETPAGLAEGEDAPNAVEGGLGG